MPTKKKSVKKKPQCPNPSGKCKSSSFVQLRGPEMVGIRYTNKKRLKQCMECQWTWTERIGPEEREKLIERETLGLQGVTDPKQLRKLEKQAGLSK